MKIQYRTSADVLVIGMGAAGIKASIRACEKGADVLMIGKCAFGRTGATFYPGTPGWGMQAVLHEGDTEEHFLEEILDAGAGAADPELARILAYGATPAFREMEGYGLEFAKDENGKYRAVIPCFGKRVRGAGVYDMNVIRRIMWRQLMAHGVRVRSQVSAVALVKKDGVVCGVIVADEMNDLAFIAAKSVVLATGGACGIYEYSLATPDETGDGYALALDVGARLVNIEFIQFIPGLTWPVKKKLFQEKNLATIPKFTNRLGEDVVRKYLPEKYTVEECLIERAKHGPFTTQDISFFVDIGLYEEHRNGNCMPSGGVHVQYDPKILKSKDWNITHWLEWMNSLGVDPVREGFDMVPHAQCFNGGIAIDRDAATGVPGLFAAGENAGGPHGADRLGGAAIAATQVFGGIAGNSAAEYAKHAGVPDVSDAELCEVLEKKFSRCWGDVEAIQDKMAKIRGIMWENGAIVRSEERLNQGLAGVAALEAETVPGKHYETGEEIRSASELYSYFALSKALLGVMRERRESRGPHYRSDHPAQVDSFRGRISVGLNDGELNYEFKWS